jgi:hypothetical protein
MNTRRERFCLHAGARPLILIAYTTHYRGGGRELERAAHTLAAALRKADPATPVRCVATERKARFIAELRAAQQAAEPLGALHFFGHSGMYGPMFGTTAYPEQLSPHEWRQLAPLPFAPGATATFHACRTARWFTSFFAQTFGVPALGYHGYTTFSLHPTRFRQRPDARAAAARAGLPMRTHASGRPVALVVIGGRGTVRSGVYGRALRAEGLTMLQRVAQPLSALVEAGVVDGPAVDAAIAPTVAPLRGCAAVLLGCTHYPALREPLQRALPGVRLLDPAPRLVADVLADLGTLAFDRRTT